MFDGHDPEGEEISGIKWMISLTVHYKPQSNQNAFLELSSPPLMYMFSQKTFIDTIFWDQIMV